MPDPDPLKELFSLRESTTKPNDKQSMSRRMISKPRPIHGVMITLLKLTMLYKELLVQKTIVDKDFSYTIILVRYCSCNATKTTMMVFECSHLKKNNLTNLQYIFYFPNQIIEIDNNANESNMPNESRAFLLHILVS